jgi:hypothetical protein
MRLRMKEFLWRWGPLTIIVIGLVVLLWSCAGCGGRTDTGGGPLTNAEAQIPALAQTVEAQAVRLDAARPIIADAKRAPDAAAAQAPIIADVAKTLHGTAPRFRDVAGNIAQAQRDDAEQKADIAYLKNWTATFKKMAWLGVIALAVGIGVTVFLKGALNIGPAIAAGGAAMALTAVVLNAIHGIPWWFWALGVALAVAGLVELVWDAWRRGWNWSAALATPPWADLSLKRRGAT